MSGEPYGGSRDDRCCCHGWPILWEVGGLEIRVWFFVKKVFIWLRMRLCDKRLTLTHCGGIQTLLCKVHINNGCSII